eukprot:scaffold16243_cov59-Phaeocystis_antarctica.AAC.5
MGGGSTVSVMIDMSAGPSAWMRAAPLGAILRHTVVAADDGLRLVLALQPDPLGAAHAHVGGDVARAAVGAAARRRDVLAEDGLVLPDGLHDLQQLGVGQAEGRVVRLGAGHLAADLLLLRLLLGHVDEGLVEHDLAGHALEVGGQAARDRLGIARRHVGRGALGAVRILGAQHAPNLSQLASPLVLDTHRELRRSRAAREGSRWRTRWGAGSRKKAPGAGSHKNRALAWGARDVGDRHHRV